MTLTIHKTGIKLILKQNNVLKIILGFNYYAGYNQSNKWHNL